MASSQSARVSASTNRLPRYDGIVQLGQETSSHTGQVGSDPLSRPGACSVSECFHSLPYRRISQHSVVLGRNRRIMINQHGQRDSCWFFPEMAHCSRHSWRAVRPDASGPSLSVRSAPCSKSISVTSACPRSAAQSRAFRPCSSSTLSMVLISSGSIVSKIACTMLTQSE